MNDILQTPIEYLKGVGPSRGEMLRKELSIHRYGDLLTLFPNRYIDRTRYFKINQLQNNNSEVQIIGKIINVKTVEFGKGRKRLVATFVDETGQMELVWFQGHKWIRESLKINELMVIFGKCTSFNGLYNMAHPEMELVTQVDPEKLTGYQPMYNTTEKVKQKGFDNKSLGKLLKTLIAGLTPQDVPEILPPSIMQQYHFMSRYDALLNIHFPSDNKSLDKALARLKFEEFFTIQVKLLGVDTLIINFYIQILINYIV